jgi:hypothetical protein
MGKERWGGWDTKVKSTPGWLAVGGGRWLSRAETRLQGSGLCPTFSRSKLDEASATLLNEPSCLEASASRIGHPVWSAHLRCASRKARSSAPINTKHPRRAWLSLPQLPECSSGHVSKPSKELPAN